jgi:hypothetical protein
MYNIADSVLHNVTHRILSRAFWRVLKLFKTRIIQHKLVEASQAGFKKCAEDL